MLTCSCIYKQQCEVNPMQYDRIKRSVQDLKDTTIFSLCDKYFKRIMVVLNVFKIAFDVVVRILS